MSESYRAILVNGRLRWLDDVPDAIRHGGRKVQVRVTIEKAKEENEDDLGALLDKLANADLYSDIDDPVEWQRRLRRE